MLIRRRLLYWLLKEYLRKWGKAILFFFIIGLIIFFTILFSLRSFATKIPLGKKESIGLVGSYTVDLLPSTILTDISSGLTKIGPDGKAVPDIASSWKIQDKDKKYIFTLKKNITYTDGKPVTTDTIRYNFSDAKFEKIDEHTLSFTLKESYSPFLLTVSKPIIRDGFIGIGKYKMKNLKLNGNFVESITLSLREDPLQTLTYQFYPNASTLKLAYVMGEVSKAMGLTNLDFQDTKLETFPNTTVTKKTNYNQLTTLFFNTTDSMLSEKRIRNSLAYSIPDYFEKGERNPSPLPAFSWAYTDQFVYSQDIEHAIELLKGSASASKSAVLSLELKTLPRYKNTAETIAKEWEKLGIKTKIIPVESVPLQFQAFLGDFFVPKDPDQYMLWHSGEQNNITKYENKRIDKLLEDGRKITGLNERKKIYSDFQKYLLADTPAIFLYFPYEYEVERK